jgi:hypothetical protein
VQSVAWSPNGRRIASGGWDETVRIWESHLEDLVGMWHGAARRRVLAPTIATLFEEHLLLEPVLAALGADASLSPEQRQLAMHLAKAQDRAARHRVVYPIVEGLFYELILVESVLAALEADASLSPEQRQLALLLAKARGNPVPSDLNNLAWPLIDPDREATNTDTVFALRLIRAGVAAVEEEGWEDSEFHVNLDTLAWALFANSMHEEAIGASERALTSDLGKFGKEAFSLQARLKKMVAEAQK